MKKTLILLFTLTLLVGTVEISKADFMIDPNPGGEKFFIDKPANPTTFFTGDGGSQNSGVGVSVVTDVNVTTGSGYANIKPVKDSTLTVLTFTPDDKDLFGDFSFRGQLDKAGTVTVTVWDSPTATGQTFSFTNLPKSADFGRIGIISTDGETIYQVKISNPSFKEVKQIEFSHAVPEPGILILLGLSLTAIGVASRFVRKI